MLLSYCLPLLMIVQAAVAQTNSSLPAQQQPTDKPAGLPTVQWDILRMEPNARENLCQRQTAYCANNCGGPSEAPKNFCNSTSMAWGCGCKNKNPDFTPFLWPVVQAECSGKLQECQILCNTETNRSNTCATTCNAYYQCGTDKAPPSYLQTENPTDTPSYDGPPTAKKIDGSSIDNNSTDNSSTKTSESSSSAVYSKYLFSTVIMTSVLGFLKY
ncbi:unnamed protein product [Mucor hiemalis]